MNNLKKRPQYRDDVRIRIKSKETRESGSAYIVKPEIIFYHTSFTRACFDTKLLLYLSILIISNFNTVEYIFTIPKIYDNRCCNIRKYTFTCQCISTYQRRYESRLFRHSIYFPTSNNIACIFQQSLGH